MEDIYEMIYQFMGSGILFFMLEIYKSMILTSIIACTGFLILSIRALKKY
jgi:hypothetical protein